MILILNTFRRFAGNRQEVELLKYLAIGYSICNGFFRPVWGFLFDKFGFKKLFVTLNFFQMLISGSVYFMVEDTIIFSTLVLLSGFLQAGLFSLMPSFVSKIFGIKLSSEVYGFVFMAFGIAGLISPIIIYSLNHSGIPSGETYPFLIAYLIGTVCSLISTLICFFTSEEKYIY